MAVRPSKPLEAFIADHLGPAPGRDGERSDRHWWVCPFHADSNPSLAVKPGDSTFHCFGCGAHGDAIAFLTKLNPGMKFPEAKAIVEGEALPQPRPVRPVATPRPKPKAAPKPEGWQGFIRGLIEEGERALWSEEGEAARSYLNGRGLQAKTIRAARLGMLAEDRHDAAVYADRSIWIPAGLLIPWFDGPDVAMVNVRRPDGCDPKYRTVRGSRRGKPYPATRAIQAGRPLVVVEGEFEALLLGQELGGLAPVVTFGSASDRPKGPALAPILSACPWYIATDADDAGEKSAEGWSTASDRSVRVRPPGAFKDWTEARAGGVDLRRWWTDRLAGTESPPLFTWAELSVKRWGVDPAPTLDVGRDRPLRPL